MLVLKHIPMHMYISTGIYRCSLLDFDMNFARIPSSQESARINAFFIMFLHPPPHITPQRGFCNDGLHCKFIIIFPFPLFF